MRSRDSGRGAEAKKAGVVGLHGCVCRHPLLDDPVYFEVDEFQTVRDLRVTEPATRADVFEDIELAGIKTPADLIVIAEAGPLRDRLSDLADERRQEIERLLDGELPPGGRRRLKRIAGLLADPDDRWKHWVRLEGRRSMTGLRKFVTDWLAEPIDWDEHVWFPDDIGSIGAAKVYFDSLDFETLDELAIKIAEGEYPGSTYYTAELMVAVEVANVVAARLGVPCGFAVANRRANPYRGPMRPPSSHASATTQGYTHLHPLQFERRLGERTSHGPTLLTAFLRSRRNHHGENVDLVRSRILADLSTQEPAEPGSRMREAHQSSLSEAEDWLAIKSCCIVHLKCG